jgi:hypothetical protein
MITFTTSLENVTFVTEMPVNGSFFSTISLFDNDKMLLELNKKSGAKNNGFTVWKRPDNPIAGVYEYINGYTIVCEPNKLSINQDLTFNHENMIFPNPIEVVAQIVLNQMAQANAPITSCGINFKSVTQDISPELTTKKFLSDKSKKLFEVTQTRLQFHAKLISVNATSHVIDVFHQQPNSEWQIASNFHHEILEKGKKRTQYLEQLLLNMKDYRTEFDATLEKMKEVYSEQ